MLRSNKRLSARIHLASIESCQITWTAKFFVEFCRQWKFWRFVYDFLYNKLVFSYILTFFSTQFLAIQAHGYSKNPQDESADTCSHGPNEAVQHTLPPCRFSSKTSLAHWVPAQSHSPAAKTTTSPQPPCRKQYAPTTRDSSNNNNTRCATVFRSCLSISPST